LAGDILTVREGVWEPGAAKLSSNYRELSNLVETLEEGVASCQLLNTEYFLFTDNTTAELVFHNGTSSSPLLFELALRLHTLEMRGDFQFHMVHVAGTRMIAQGSEGISQGCLSEGVMSGKAMLSYIPLHLSALDRPPICRPGLGLGLTNLS
jgi:hypothetical protein